MNETDILIEQETSLTEQEECAIRTLIEATTKVLKEDGSTKALEGNGAVTSVMMRDEIIKELTEQMQEYSLNQQYEKAAIARDKINAIKKISEKQKVSNLNENSIDVIGLYKNELATCIEIFFIRNSKMIGREHYFLNDLQEEKIEDILSIFIKQYYMKKLDIPNKIMIQQEISDSENISKMLNMAFNKNIEFKIL